MKKNAAFLYDLFRPDPVPVDDEADLAVVAAVDPSEVIPPEADATKADDHVPDEEWRFPWETEPLESESQPSLADVDGVTWVHRPDHAERYGWEPVGVPSEDRWWARCGFDDLPVPPQDLVVGSLRKPANTASKLE